MTAKDLIGEPIFCDSWDRWQTIVEVLIHARDSSPIIVTSRREMYKLNDITLLLKENEELLNKIKQVFPEEFI